jgi:transposase
MSKQNVSKKECQINTSLGGDYQHFIAIDWSMQIMAIARFKPGWKEPKVFEKASDVSELKMMLMQLKGKKIVTFEETTSAHWLYIELCDYADYILICDPYRNRLLLDGPKTDKIDAKKLCHLLYGGLLKEVYHSLSVTFEIRRLVSAYEDVVGAGVRSLNQKSGYLRALGATKNPSKDKMTSYIFSHLDKYIELYHDTKESYEKKFKSLCKSNDTLKALKSLNGIGEIGAVKIYATVINPYRFPTKGHYLSYCGLVKLKKISGLKIYGKKKSRFSRRLKSVYKTAASVALKGNNPIKEYYDYLLKKGIAEHNARNSVARYLATISYGIMKSKERYQPYQWRKRSVYVPSK